MPEIAPIEIGMLAGMLIIGVALGWIFRAVRCAKEKIAVNAGWQEQLETQRGEQDRLEEQNKSLMEQISQYQASIKDSNLRAKELADSLKEAFERSDALQRQVKEYRGSLEVATAQRDKLQASVATREARDGASATAIREKDEKIFGLSRELTAWQNRVPPLVERFRTRDLEAKELEVGLQQARERITALESVTGPDHTRIEPVDPNTLADGLSASNDPLDTLTSQFDNELVDQDDSFNEAFATVDASPSDTEARVATDAPTDAATGISDAEFSAISDTFSGIFDQPEHPAKDHPAELPAAEPDAVVNDSKVAGNDTDDLKLIKGVGPVIEKTLNNLGIYRFNQIAEMSEFDIDRVAQQLKGFRSRIYREDWVGQARNLQHQKNNDRA
jgi:predicted flap endonuclease-1-like 5' DNA nuclease